MRRATVVLTLLTLAAVSVVSEAGSLDVRAGAFFPETHSNLFVDDAAFATELRCSLFEAMRLGARRVPPRQWKRKPLRLRVRIWLAYALARLFVALAGVDRYH